MEDMVINSKFWNERKVFITGHTGFKGGWLSLWLSMMKARVMGFSLDEQKIFEGFGHFDISELVERSVMGDIRNKVHLKECLNEFSPEIIIHMAAQPLVRASYINPL